MAYFGSGSGLKMLLEAIRSILTEYQPVISILDPFQANCHDFMSHKFPRLSKNLNKLTPGGSGRPRTILCWHYRQRRNCQNSHWFDLSPDPCNSDVHEKMDLFDEFLDLLKCSQEPLGSLLAL